MHTPSIQLAVIDSSLPGATTLLQALPDTAAVCWVDPQQDGLAVIAERLAALDTPCGALHVLSHGAPGLLHLGVQAYSTDNLGQHAALLARIGGHLSADAVVCLYGCEIAAGVGGRAFVETLAQLVGAEVEAATHVIGAHTQWTLDHATGAWPGKALAFPAFSSTLAVITTGAGNDVVPGTSADDTIDGGTGADTMTGGLGNDTYLRDNTGDLITENLNEGIDAVLSAVNYTLAANLERLTLTGAATNGGGNALDNLLTGNALANLLAGAAGNDTLDGGAGADTLIGGLGNDSYARDNAGDVITENTGEGTDTVTSSLNYTLSANLENLVLSGSATNGGGNALDNVMSGNALNNLLAGATGDDTLDGGTGIDTLIGGLGNDSYVRDNAGDVIVENADEGSDTVTSSLNYTLGANLENLTLTGSATNGGGNALDNRIFGNALNNLLVGAAGRDYLVGDAGNDTLNGGLDSDGLVGGTGNDTYLVDETGDTILEYGGEGVDTVISSAIVYDIYSTGVDQLILVGQATYGRGNNLDNAITGNALDNTLMGELGNDTLIGNAGNDRLVAGDGIDSLLGGTGDDFYEVINAAAIIVENAGEGTDAVTTTVDFTLSDNVENLTFAYVGSAADHGIGNALGNWMTGDASADTLEGHAGNDTLDGGGSADTLIGGTGNDRYLIDSTNDVVIEVNGEGVDTVVSGANYTLAANVENLTLSAFATNGGGNSLDNLITGNEFDNLLAGNSGNDTLDGSTGADTLMGGLGNDTYLRDNPGDVIAENAGEGTDTVTSSINYTLAANVENLVLNGDAFNGGGNDLNNVITGNGWANLLTGGAGQDSLSGATGNDTLDGGAGADTMTGGSGDDAYARDNASDMIIENNGEGTDTVTSSVNYTLGANLEHLLLSGIATNGGGNALDNQITGNALANLLAGAAGNDTLDGGAGIDTLIGGLGNDSYVRDHVGDVITETAGEGIDTVTSSVNYTLSANVEQLVLSGSATNGGGNALNNLLTGNWLNNLLAGAGGNDTLDGATGADTLIGGLGDDSYLRSDAGDLIIENAGEGIDTVTSDVDYTLAANLENLQLNQYASFGAGNALDNGIRGNVFDNLLVGGAGNDTLRGHLGDDTLNGGAGNDVFLFDMPSDLYYVDVINDYQAGDTIGFDNDVFTTLGATLDAAGSLAPAQFYSGAGVTGGSSADQIAGIYYDTSTGSLYYDADGNGGAAGMQFAIVSGAPTLTSSAFIVVD